MGIAAYEISGHGKEWRIRHDGESENVYETKKAAFEVGSRGGLSRDESGPSDQDFSTGF